MSSNGNGINRRKFVQSGVLGTVAAGVVPVLAAGEQNTQSSPDPKTILNYNPAMKYRRLGNTDIYFSSISLGGLVMDAPTHHYAIEHGVNLVHVAEDYIRGQAIKVLGEVLKTKRDKVYLAVKDNFGDIDAVLKTLNTDHIDFLMFNRHDESSAADPGVKETFEKYKKAGKVRFCGLTSHGNVKTATAAGLRSGMYTLVMPAMNQSAFEAMTEELRTAQEKGIGVMPIKTMRGIGDREAQLAYLKKMLRNPAITTVLKGIGSFEMFDAWLKAANEPLTIAEDLLLYRHAQSNRSRNCMACGECTSVCPQAVEVATVLRCKDYYHDQVRDVETAVTTWRAIAENQRGSDACRLCRKCEPACPNGIGIVQRLEAARELFSTMA